MRVFDAHCDALSKLLADPSLSFQSTQGLEVTLPRLEKAEAIAQAFAMFLDEEEESPKFDRLLKMVDLFYEKIVSHKEMKMIRTKTDLQNLQPNQIGALLTLEGAGGLEGDLDHLRVLQKLGLRCLGLTWNYANWAADGVKEPRKAGLSVKGRELIRECERLEVILDVSHLNEKGFWELAELCKRPFIASHSNVYEVCQHPRNLRQEQIQTIIQMEGCIGITFVPYFTADSKNVTIHQLLPHIDRICSLGGEKQLGIGSDFDGISQWIEGLHDPGDLYRLTDILLRYYSDEQVKGFMYKNWYRFFEKNLP